MPRVPQGETDFTVEPPRLPKAPAPPPDAQENQEPQFGFASEDLEIAWRGIGDSRAKELSRRFRPILDVAAGGMGKIVLAEDRIAGRYVALKVMLEHALTRRSLVQQFVREAVITARLQHPHIIPVYELGFLDHGQLFYTMRFIDGQSFAKVMGGMDLDDRLRVLRDAALAVGFAHASGLWHRDIKPQNIMVGGFGDVYVADWGLVSVQPGKEYKLNLPKILVQKTGMEIAEDHLLEDTSSAATVEPGAVMGTPGYMAPEQCMASPESGAISDVWAFGVMLFEVLTDRHPLKLNGNHGDLVAQTICNEQLPHPRDIDAETPEVLGNLCHRMLAHNSRERFPSLPDFAREIAAYLKSTRSTSVMFPAGTAPTIPVAASANTDQLDRERRKNSLLLEVLALSPLRWRRRRQLWAEIARL